MQALTRPARAGIHWFLGGIHLTRRAPFALMGLVVAYWFFVLFLSAIPYLGTLLSSLAMPALSVGMMNACRRIEQGESPRIDALFSGFKNHLNTLLALGALYLSVTLLILYISSLFDDGTLMAVMTGQRADPTALQSEAFSTAAQVALILLAPVVMAYWYAPLLVAWHGVPVAKALFFSFVACWRNWKAFLVYGLMCILALIPVALVGLAMAATGLLSLVFLGTLLILGPLLFCTFYVTYRDVFVSRPHVDTTDTASDSD